MFQLYHRRHGGVSCRPFQWTSSAYGLTEIIAAQQRLATATATVTTHNQLAAATSSIATTATLIGASMTTMSSLSDMRLSSTSSSCTTSRAGKTLSFTTTLPHHSLSHSPSLSFFHSPLATPSFRHFHTTLSHLSESTSDSLSPEESSSTTNSSAAVTGGNPFAELPEDALPYHYPMAPRRYHRFLQLDDLFKMNAQIWHMWKALAQVDPHSCQACQHLRETRRNAQQEKQQHQHIQHTLAAAHQTTAAAASSSSSSSSSSATTATDSSTSSPSPSPSSSSSPLSGDTPSASCDDPLCLNCLHKVFALFMPSPMLYSKQLYIKAAQSMGKAPAAATNNTTSQHDNHQVDEKEEEEEEEEEDEDDDEDEDKEEDSPKRSSRRKIKPIQRASESFWDFLKSPKAVGLPKSPEEASVIFSSYPAYVSSRTPFISQDIVRNTFTDFLDEFLRHADRSSLRNPSVLARLLSHWPLVQRKFQSISQLMKSKSELVNPTPRELAAFTEKLHEAASNLLSNRAAFKRPIVKPLPFQMSAIIHYLHQNYLPPGHPSAAINKHHFDLFASIPTFDPQLMSSDSLLSPSKASGIWLTLFRYALSSRPLGRHPVIVHNPVLTWAQQAFFHFLHTVSSSPNFNLEHGYLCMAVISQALINASRADPTFVPKLVTTMQAMPHPRTIELTRTTFHAYRLREFAAIARVSRKSSNFFSWATSHFEFSGLLTIALTRTNAEEGVSFIRQLEWRFPLHDLKISVHGRKRNSFYLCTLRTYAFHTLSDRIDRLYRHRDRKLLPSLIPNINDLIITSQQGYDQTIDRRKSMAERWRLTREYVLCRPETDFPIMPQREAPDDAREIEDEEDANPEEEDDFVNTLQRSIQEVDSIIVTHEQLFLSLYRQLVESRNQLKERTYSTLVRGLHSAQSLKEFYEVFSAEQPILPGPVFYHFLLQACIRSYSYQLGVKVINKLLTDFKYNVFPIDFQLAREILHLSSIIFIMQRLKKHKADSATPFHLPTTVPAEVNVFYEALLSIAAGQSDPEQRAKAILQVRKAGAVQAAAWCDDALLLEHLQYIKKNYKASTVGPFKSFVVNGWILYHRLPSLLHVNLLTTRSLIPSTYLPTLFELYYKTFGGLKTVPISAHSHMSFTIIFNQKLVPLHVTSHQKVMEVLTYFL